MSKMIFKKGAAIFIAAVALVFVGTAFFERDRFSGYAAEPESVQMQTKTFDMSQVKTVQLEGSYHQSFEVIYSENAQNEAKVILASGSEAELVAGVLHVRSVNGSNSVVVTLPYQTNTLLVGKKGSDDESDWVEVVISNRGAGAMPDLNVIGYDESQVRFNDFVADKLSVKVRGNSMNSPALTFSGHIELSHLNVAISHGQLRFDNDGYGDDQQERKPFVMKQGTLKFGPQAQFSTTYPTQLKGLTFEALP